MKRLILFAGAALAACAGRSDIVLPAKPLPKVVIDVDIHDTLFMTRSESYEVMALRRADLPNKAALDSAVQTYRELRGEVPNQVTVFVGLNAPVGTQPPMALDTVDVAVYGASAGLIPSALLKGYLFDAWDRAATVSGGKSK